jgi:cellulase
MQAPIAATIAAGATIEMLWNTWPLGHYGPVMNYMAKCTGTTCSTYTGNGGSPWFKISQNAFDGTTNTWASDQLANNNHSWTVQIPSNISPGQYVSSIYSFLIRVM